MIQLPNGCYCSDITVSPKNWDKTGASTKKNWFIYYRFYDPTYKDTKGKIKPVLRHIKGMNAYKLLGERRAACRLLIENELKLLREQAYNPVTATVKSVEDFVQGIEPHIGFLQALELAAQKIVCERHTKEDIKSMLKYFGMSLAQLRYSTLAISTVRRKHIKVALAQCEVVKDKWTANVFNKYRSYLMVLFAELVEHDAIEFNPVRDLKKMKRIEKLRVTLTDDERKLVDEHLKTNYYTFWRFMQIFFHSGGRINEMLLLKYSEVNLKDQTYKVTIRKGRSGKEVLKTIKDIALPFWEELLQDAKPSDYVFSQGLEPGPSNIRREQLTRRWDVHVKKKLGIKADLYSLKHLNTTEIVDALGMEDAARLNGHTSTAMVQGIYDVRAKQRQHERLKKVGNAF